ncbi:MAG: LysR family transcriptional regulator [Burkholderiaceae bacterium]|nr:LysR family transcriptional regulator [Pseudomonadota bacterium]MBS0598140.1 LysR family transcriptional regulator [Pseudomonadota bacterium]MCP5219845.1 LysR family transcriptional regulator [Burkholderiaceae bacterium]
MRIKPMSPRSLGYAPADKRIELLRRVGECGSISQAARSAGVSYKAAWQAIHTLTNLAGEPLVDSSVGGAGGGGARLTAAGARLLRAAEQMDAARHDVLARINDPAAQALAAPRTSMRNHLPCTVARLDSVGPGDPLVRVVLALPEGGEMTSLITRESAQLLGLAPGLDLLALCKATAVRIGPWGDDASPADANRLPGRVLRAARGTRHDELTLTLAGGLQLVGFAAHPNRLRAGSRAQAQVEPSAVVLALR